MTVKPSQNRSSVMVSVKNPMEHNETDCQAQERPILCINNCGFFGSSATMNMCSKCHKDLILKQEQAQLAHSSFDNLANVGSSKDHIVSGNADVDASSMEPKLCLGQSSSDSGAAGMVAKAKAKAGGPNRCNSCGKRVGLTGFSCRCGNVFCATHRYSDKHDCQFDYRQAAQDAIAKANPVVKAEKLDKI